MVYFWEIIPFYGRTIQVSEILCHLPRYMGWDVILPIDFHSMVFRSMLWWKAPGLDRWPQWRNDLDPWWPTREGMGWLTRPSLTMVTMWLKGQHYGQAPISSLDMFRCILWYSNMDSGEIHKKKIEAFLSENQRNKSGISPGHVWLTEGG